MMNKEDDDSFLEEFMARAQRRQAKLAQIGKEVVDSTSEHGGDVTYPALSPLQEEENYEAQSPEVTEHSNHDDEISHTHTEDRGENVTPDPNYSTYSSDLSLDCDTNNAGEEIYRAEPVRCHSSPEQLPYSQQASPRKQLAPAPRQQQNYLPEPHVIFQENQPEQKATSSQSLPEISSSEQLLRELQLQVGLAEQRRTQLKKALEVPKYGSRDHIEAARLLQIAEIQHLNYTNHLAIFKQGIRKKTESLGSVKIFGIKLKISSKLRNDLAEDGVSHYFFCVASCATEVKATNIMDTDSIKRQDLKAYLEFKEVISFADLPPDFIVKIEVFELVTGQHLPKLLSRLTPSKKSRITPESNFRRVGSLRLALADRDVSHKNLVQWGDNENSKYLERECKFSMELRPEQLPEKAGMLHVRCLDNEGRPDWSRLWVKLSCGEIQLWRSKQDALDEKKANQILKFGDLCTDKVQKLTPDDDLYRQNSFVLYSFQQVAGGERDTLFQRLLHDEPKFKIVKHQMAAENKEDRDSWCAVLDRSMSCFREWHGKTKIYSIDEIKDIFSSTY